MIADDPTWASPYTPARVLITVKTYPQPSTKYVETVCTAGISDGGALIRLYPIPFRRLGSTQQYKKYQWIAVRVRKRSADARPESYSVDGASIRIDGEVGMEDGWAARKALVLPLVSSSLEAIKAEQAVTGRSLGIIRPRRIKRFRVKPAERADWSAEERAKLRRTDLFAGAPPWLLEKVPWTFHYEFECDDPACRGHDMQVLDWEVFQAYRSWSSQPGKDWRRMLDQKFAEELVVKRDLHFFVGTMQAYPKSWTIIGLFYPPRVTAPLQVARPGRQQLAELVGEERPMAQGRLPFEAE